MYKKKYSRELGIISKNEFFFEHPLIEQKDINAVTTALKLGDISWPDGATNRLENYFSRKFYSKYVVAHCNATSAMFSAFSAIELTKKDEIISPTYTWWASISPALFFYSKIVFCDSSKETLTPSLEDIKEKVTAKTRAVVLSHLWGEIGELRKISKFCKEQNIFLIEDNSHGIGAKVGSKFVGTFGDICVTSLQKNKGVSGGEGGLLSTNSKELYEKSLFLGHYERLRQVTDLNLRKFSSTGGGLKFRIHPLASALAFSRLERLDKQIRVENKLMSTFREKLSKIESVKVFQTNEPTFVRGAGFSFRFYLELTDFNLPKTNLLDSLQKKGFPVTGEYYPLLHKQELFKKFSESEYPTIGQIHPKLFAHPIFRRGTKKQVIEYTRLLRDQLNLLKNVKN